jgi:hypothetical protein
MSKLLREAAKMAVTAEARAEELEAENARLRAALGKIANRFEDAQSSYTIEGQTRDEARAALKSK